MHHHQEEDSGDGGWLQSISDGRVGARAQRHYTTLNSLSFSFSHSF